MPHSIITGNGSWRGAHGAAHRAMRRGSLVAWRNSQSTLGSRSLPMQPLGGDELRAHLISSRSLDVDATSWARQVSVRL